jgi:hypothetical protein
MQKQRQAEFVRDSRKYAPARMAPARIPLRQGRTIGLA